MSDLSFSDCPNKCVDGYYVDPYIHNRIQCNYCMEKRKGVVRDSVRLDSSEDLSEKLNLPKSFTGYGKFDINEVIPSTSIKCMTPDSVSKVSERLKSMLDKVSAGELVEHSVLVNLGRKAFESKFIYSYLVRAYVAGFTVSPYTSTYDLIVLRSGAEGGNVDKREKFDALLHTDVCVVVIDTGATIQDINAVKGLMQLRAHYDKSTLIFTNAWGSLKEIRDLCSEDGILCKNLAEVLSVEYLPNYKDSSNTKSSTPQKPNIKNTPVGISNSDFNALMSPQKNVL